MDRDELAFTYFPDNYRWSHGFLLALGAAPWGGGEIGEINRVGLRLAATQSGDDRAWFEEWARMAERVETVGRERAASRSEEHTSELQSRLHLVCRLLLEKKKKEDTST